LKHKRSLAKEQIDNLHKIDLNGEEIALRDLTKVPNNEKFNKVKRADSINEIRPSVSNSPLRKGKETVVMIDSPSRKFRKDRVNKTEENDRTEKTDS